MRKINKVLSLCSRMLKQGKDRVKFNSGKIDQEFKLDFSRNMIRQYLKFHLCKTL